jgi:hypothetical protein
MERRPKKNTRVLFELGLLAVIAVTLGVYFGAFYATSAATSPSPSPVAYITINSTLPSIDVSTFDATSAAEALGLPPGTPITIVDLPVSTTVRFAGVSSLSATQLSNAAAAVRDQLPDSIRQTARVTATVAPSRRRVLDVSVLVSVTNLGDSTTLAGSVAAAISELENVTTLLAAVGATSASQTPPVVAAQVVASVPAPSPPPLPPSPPSAPEPETYLGPYTTYPTVQCTTFLGHGAFVTVDNQTTLRYVRLDPNNHGQFIHYPWLNQLSTCTTRLNFSSSVLSLSPGSSSHGEPYWTWDGPGRAIALGGDPDPTTAARLHAPSRLEVNLGYSYWLTLSRGWLWPSGAGASPRDGAYDTLNPSQIYKYTNEFTPHMRVDNSMQGNGFNSGLYKIVVEGLVSQFPGEFQLGSDGWMDCLVCKQPLAAGVTVDSINRKYPPLTLEFNGYSPPGFNKWMDQYTCGSARCGDKAVFLNVPASGAYMTIVDGRLNFFAIRKYETDYQNNLGDPFLTSFKVVYENQAGSFAGAYFTGDETAKYVLGG